MTSLKMTPTERTAVFSLSTIMALRMLGLFMVLPLFSLYASHLADATPFLIGLAMGIYGLTQALLQIPFGALSDHFGRKKIITLGFCIFAVGSAIAAMSHGIWGLLIGRALQGAGAIGSTLIALIADLTQPTQRTKAMAITGITIGMSFSLAMVIGPILAAWIQIQGVFWLAVLFSLIAILILYSIVPTPATIVQPIETESKWRQWLTLLKDPALSQLNISIFLLHLIFTASFVVIPISLFKDLALSSHQQWWLYLPALIIAFLICMTCIRIAEKKQKIKYFYIAAIITFIIAESILSLYANNLLLSAFSLLLFFSAFTLLEAFLPSLVSRTAPAHRKGTALGIYSCSQFLGIFIGGTVGGWLYGLFNTSAVYLFCAILATLWAAIAFTMKNPQYSTTSH